MVVVDCVVTVCCVVGHTTQAGECAAVPANKRRGYAAQPVHCHFAGTRDRVTQILRCCIDFSFPVFLTAVVSLIVSALCVELLDYHKCQNKGPGGERVTAPGYENRVSFVVS